LVGEESAGTELEIIVDDEPRLEILLGVWLRHAKVVFGYLRLFLHLQKFRKVTSALAGLEDAQWNYQPLQLILVVVVVFRFCSGQRNRRSRIGRR
jgi:hypothetical protein